MDNKKILITGGAGFVGSNLADSLLRDGCQVLILDSLGRHGTQENLHWLQSRHPKGLDFVHGDIQDRVLLRQLVKGVKEVYHLAAQVAVTSSVTDPVHDFNINALGTLNILEAVRSSGEFIPLLFTSTNKVYGALEGARVTETASRYALEDLPQGINETQALDFLSPYGCSKGAADQYVRDYARIYGLPTVVFRMSCIYGPRQFGNEDQGWVAHFVISAVLGQPITIYGDGKQVRDLLYVEDLVRAFRLATENINITKGQVYNIGGGHANSLAVWREFEPLLRGLLGRPIQVSYGNWRPGDQKVYISDISRAARDFNWQPSVSKERGIEKLFHWADENQKMLAEWRSRFA